VFSLFRLPCCKVYFLLFGISTFVWGKHLGRSKQISREVLYVLSVFSKDLQWSFIVVNANVLNTSLSSKPSNMYY